MQDCSISLLAKAVLYNLVTMLCVVTQTTGRSASNTDCFFQDAERRVECVPTQSVGTRWKTMEEK